MTVAVSEALALRDCLRHGTAELGLRFRARTGAIVDIPWQIAVGSDLRFPEVEGPRTAKIQLVNAHLARLHVAAATDPEVGRAFLRVVNLIDRPERLLRPAIALRVLRGQRRPRLAYPAPDTAALEGPVEPFRGTGRSGQDAGSCTTDRMFPSGSLNQAPRVPPRSAMPLTVFSPGRS
jgi:hypothetical protein